MMNVTECAKESEPDYRRRLEAEKMAKMRAENDSGLYNQDQDVQTKGLGSVTPRTGKTQLKKVIEGMRFNGGQHLNEGQQCLERAVCLEELLNALPTVLPPLAERGLLHLLNSL